jgi:hypothetical protein
MNQLVIFQNNNFVLRNQPKKGMSSFFIDNSKHNIDRGYLIIDK